MVGSTDYILYHQRSGYTMSSSDLKLKATFVIFCTTISPAHTFVVEGRMAHLIQPRERGEGLSAAYGSLHYSSWPCNDNRFYVESEGEELVTGQQYTHILDCF